MLKCFPNPLLFQVLWWCFFWGKAFHGYVNWKWCKIFRNDLKMTKFPFLFKLCRRVEGILLLMEKILHQLIGSLSHYLHGFIHPRWLFRNSSINSNLLTSFRLVVLACFGPGPRLLQRIWRREARQVFQKSLGFCSRACEAWDSLWCSPSSGKWRLK